jgi:2-dehydro-3-deoxyphosphogluconate aldolase / (4S)-4-hydroxy-2-oxoglutarate aldolase
MMVSEATIVEKLEASGLIPLFCDENAHTVQWVVEVLYEAGVRVFEFTNRKQNSLSVFSHLHEHRHRYPELLLGVGTVLDAATTKTFIEAGADFIVSPVMKPEMASVCQAYGKPWIPGCATLTEIVAARDHGAEITKVFPGSVLGPGFVSSIMPVVPGLKLMISGGVDADEKNLRAWFHAGAMCVGMGSQLFTREILQHKQAAKLHAKTLEILSIVKKIKSNQ